MSYNKVIIIGGLPGGEVWSCGLSFDADGGEGIQDPAALALFASNVGALIAAWPGSNSLRNLLSTAATITRVRTEARAEDETLINFGEFTFPTAFVGTSIPTKPYQTSFVLSLRTTFPGGSGRGRVYWPALALPIDTTTLRIAISQRTAYLADWRIFINAIIASAAPGFVLHLIVRSVTLHLSRRVSTLQAGDVADVQRRRRDALIEQYSAVPFP